MSQWPPLRIVTAVDFSEPSAAALSMAGRLAGPLGAELLVLHAEFVDVPPYFTHDQLDVIEREVRAARAHAEDAVRAFAGTHTSVPTTVKVVPAPEVDAILDAAREADLIVLGTHGRRGPKRWWLGSVAERVVREAHVPVLVVHATTSAHGQPTPLSPVVLGGAHASAAAHRWGELVATTLGGASRNGPDVDACDPAQVDATSLVIVGLPDRPADRVVHEHVVSLARTCVVPVLFVPSPATPETLAPAVLRS